jgi:hypothetical protein
LFSLYLRVATINKTLLSGCQLQTLKNGTNLPLYRPTEVTYYGRLKTGGWRLEAGGWRLETGDWRLEAGGWRLEAGGIQTSSLEPRTNVFSFAAMAFADPGS